MRSRWQSRQALTPLPLQANRGAQIDGRGETDLGFKHKNREGGCSPIN
jgi:hypothetical protein